ncbi:Uncharacterized protein Rs2_24391 [Raphanus sativus]|nr:Uncharacterized protein Rs2_24391 [Raphanus sativus]
MVDFSTGEEVSITFEYEKIANYCTICKKLTHTSRTCNMKEPHQRRADYNNHVVDEGYGPRPTQNGRDSSHENESFYQRVDRYGRPFGERVTSEASRVQPLRNKITPDNANRAPLQIGNGPPTRSVGRISAKDRLQPPGQPQLQWRVREKQSTPPLPPLPPAPRESTMVTPTPVLERNLHECEFSKQIIPTEEEVLGELREVTLQ